MKKVEDEFEAITGIATFKDKVIIDVGCGTGELVRVLTMQGAQATGIDTPEMVSKAKENSPIRDEQYVPGAGENLPFRDSYADIVIYFASLHHVPMPRMNQAIKEVHRVLKAGGIVIFVEPVGKKGSYFEVIRIVEDEREIQKHAYEAIKHAKAIGFKNVEEKMIYIERSFEDYVKLLNTFIDDEKKRNEYMVQSREVTEKICREAKVDIKDYRFKSICRVNVLEKGVRTAHPPTQDATRSAD